MKNNHDSKRQMDATKALVWTLYSTPNSNTTEESSSLQPKQPAKKRTKNE